MAEKSMVDKLSTTSLLDQALNHKAEGVVLKKRRSAGFLRCKYVNGRPYWYLVRSIRVAGKVKQEIIKYFGNRKPRIIK